MALFFDEVTSSLDSASVQNILPSIKRMTEGVTTLAITHKLAEIKDFDTIIVLDINGVVVGQGTHQALLQSCQCYQKLWRQQNPAILLPKAGVFSRNGKQLSATPAASKNDHAASESKFYSEA